IGWTSGVARSDDLGSKREFCTADPLLYGTGAGSCGRSYLSFRPNIRRARRRTDEICVEKSHQISNWSRSLCFSSPTIGSESDSIAATHRPRHSSNRPQPAKAEQRRASAHSSVRGKANAEVAGRAPNVAGKSLGHFEEKHRRISRRYRFLAQSHSGPGLFVLFAQRKAAH